MAAYREAVDADPEFADGRYNLGNALLALSRFSESETELRRALRLEPKHAKVPRKLQQVRGELTRQQQQQFEYEHQLLPVDESTDTCTDDPLCLQSFVAAANARRELHGPLIV